MKKKDRLSALVGKSKILEKKSIQFEEKTQDAITIAEELPTPQNIENAIHSVKNDGLLIKDDKDFLINDLLLMLHEKYKHIPNDFETADRQIGELIQFKVDLDNTIFFEIAKRLKVIEGFETQEWFVQKYGSVNKYIGQKFTYAKQTASNYYRVYKALGGLVDSVPPAGHFYYTKAEPFLIFFSKKNENLIPEDKLENIKLEMFKVATSEEINREEAREKAAKRKKEYSIDLKDQGKKKDSLKIFYKATKSLGHLSEVQKKELSAIIIKINHQYGLNLF